MVKTTLQDSGIYIQRFSAHISRTASSSYSLLSGLPLKVILKAGGWSKAETFARHYNKPINPEFGNSLLNHFRSEQGDSSNEYTYML